MQRHTDSAEADRTFSLNSSSNISSYFFSGHFKPTFRISFFISFWCWYDSFLMTLHWHAADARAGAAMRWQAGGRAGGARTDVGGLHLHLLEDELLVVEAIRRHVPARAAAAQRTPSL